MTFGPQRDVRRPAVQSYVMVAEWRDPGSSQQHTFRSENLPTPQERRHRR